MDSAMHAKINLKNLEKKKLHVARTLPLFPEEVVEKNT